MDRHDFVDIFERFYINLYYVLKYLLSYIIIHVNFRKINTLSKYLLINLYYTLWLAFLKEMKCTTFFYPLPFLHYGTTVPKCRYNVRHCTNQQLVTRRDSHLLVFFCRAIIRFSLYRPYTYIQCYWSRAFTKILFSYTNY